MISNWLFFAAGEIHRSCVDLRIPSQRRPRLDSLFCTIDSNTLDEPLEFLARPQRLEVGIRFHLVGLAPPRGDRPTQRVHGFVDELLGRVLTVQLGSSLILADDRAGERECGGQVIMVVEAGSRSDSMRCKACCQFL